MEFDEAVDSENEQEGTTMHPTTDDDGPTVSQLFANFNGFSSDEDDANDAVQSLWD